MKHRHKKRHAKKHTGHKHSTRNTLRDPLRFIALIIVLILGMWLVNDNQTQENTSSQPILGPNPPTLQQASSTIKSAIKNVSPHITITPQTILQGEPIMVRIVGGSTAGNIGAMKASITLPAGTPIPLHLTAYKGTLVSLYGIGINQKTGTGVITIIPSETASGTVSTTDKTGPITSTFSITARTRPEEPLPVPDQIGGNSAANQVRVASILDTENAEIATVPIEKNTAFWTSPFALPLETAPIITDPYGFNRNTGEVAIPHKGVDFKAASGTPVYAINDGIVRVVKNYTVYGGTVIIDHGLGIESLSMHLSSFVAVAGEKVTRGQLIGYSGETGFAVGPHLHLSIKINNVSIDPLKFFSLFDVAVK